MIRYANNKCLQPCQTSSLHSSHIYHRFHKTNTTLLLGGGVLDVIFMVDMLDTEDIFLHISSSTSECNDGGLQYKLEEVIDAYSYDVDFLFLTSLLIHFQYFMNRILASCLHTVHQFHIEHRRGRRRCGENKKRRKCHTVIFIFNQPYLPFYIHFL